MSTQKTCDDCTLTWDRQNNVKDIVLCPKHAATDDLLAALKQAADDINTLGENLRAGLPEAALSLVDRFNQAALGAVAKAEEGS